MSALVVLSGGQDSTTVAVIASSQYEEVHAITFDYDQRHKTEVNCARAIAKALQLTSHEVIDLNGVFHSTSPLVSNSDVSIYKDSSEVPDGIASTFVPCRNQLFLTIAANRAIALGVNTIYTGVCETDYSGYPDCRRAFVDSLEVATNLGNTGHPHGLKIETPLMLLSKADSVRLAQSVLGDRFDEVMQLTHTCYLGVKGGCGKCAACLLRDRGFNEAGVNDPIWRFRQVAA
jgi:7-cyano-7-deazaguanine synthase